MGLIFCSISKTRLQVCYLFMLVGCILRLLRARMVGGQVEHIRLGTVMVQYQGFSAIQINPFREGSGAGWPRSRYICLVPSFNIYLRKHGYLFQICNIL